ncbi:hypothetical protein PV341_38110 [Streptomyces sp. PA03-1a]|nr:hypothetical protein [Streptomyces sp. PA03-1a]MDX2813366.1 hypothetical protein [Streptomyces sp. PA03-5A]
MRTRLALATVALAAAAALTACSSGSGSTSATNDSTAAAKASAAASAKAEASGAVSHVKVVKSGFENHQTWGDNAYVVHYTITNLGKETADYFVSMEFLDKDGDVLGSTGVTADKLGVGKVNTGDSAPLDAEIGNGKISDIKSVRVASVERTPTAG